MTIEFWLTLAACAVLAAIVLVALLELYGLANRSLVQKFWCSFQKRFVVVRFRTSPFFSAYRDVESCSAFPKESQFACDKLCLGRKKTESRTIVAG